MLLIYFLVAWIVDKRAHKKSSQGRRSLRGGESEKLIVNRFSFCVSLSLFVSADLFSSHWFRGWYLRVICIIRYNSQMAFFCCSLLPQSNAGEYVTQFHYVNRQKTMIRDWGVPKTCSRIVNSLIYEVIRKWWFVVIRLVLVHSSNQ